MDDSQNPQNQQESNSSPQSSAPQPPPVVPPAQPSIGPQDVNPQTNTPSVTPSVVYRSQTDTPHPSKKIWKYLLLGFVILLILTVAGFFIFKERIFEFLYYSKYSEEYNHPILPTPSLSPDGKWQTYTPEDKSFSFSFPADWMKENGPKDLSSSSTSINVNFKQIPTTSTPIYDEKSFKDALSTFPKKDSIYIYNTVKQYVISRFKV